MMINDYKNIINKAKDIKSGDLPFSDDEIFDMIDESKGNRTIPPGPLNFLSNNKGKGTIVLLAGLMLSVLTAIYSYEIIFSSKEKHNFSEVVNSEVSELSENDMVITQLSDVSLIEADTPEIVMPSFPDAVFKGSFPGVSGQIEEADFWVLKQLSSPVHKMNTGHVHLNNAPLKDNGANMMISGLLGLNKTYESTNFGLTVMYGGGMLTNDISSQYLRKSSAQMYFADVMFNFRIPFSRQQYVQFDLGYSPVTYGLSFYDFDNANYSEPAHINTVYLKYGISYGFRNFYAGVNMGIPITQDIFNANDVPGYALEFLDYKADNIIELKAGYNYKVLSAAAGDLALKLEAAYNLNSLNENALETGNINMEGLNVFSLKAGLNFRINRGFGVR